MSFHSNFLLTKSIITPPEYKYAMTAVALLVQTVGKLTIVQVAKVGVLLSERQCRSIDRADQFDLFVMDDQQCVIAVLIKED